MGERAENNNILFIATDEITMRDIPEAFHLLGYNVLELNFTVHAQSFWPDECKQLVPILKQMDISYVVTYDFVETVAQSCHEAGCAYIAWVYDDPQKELYTPYAKYDTNFIFVFDKKQWVRLRKLGIPNVYHMPLAVSPEKIKRVLADTPKSYDHEISFVGQLYSTESFRNIILEAPKKVQEELTAYINERQLKWPDKKIDWTHPFHGSIPNEILTYLGACEKHKIQKEYHQMGEAFFYEAAFLARILANRERTTILNELAIDHEVSLFTGDTDLSLMGDRVRLHPRVGFDKEVYKVYRNSKINLNITLHCIETGISQRVFDVLGAGGFLLTNYQEELYDYFTPGKDLVVYHDLAELKELTEYYLAHEEEREEIARNGQKTVFEKHDYLLRMSRVMDIVRKHKKEQEHPVIVLTTPKDFRRLSASHEKMIQNLAPRKVFFLGSKMVKELIDESPIGEKAGFIDEEEIIPFGAVELVMKKALDVGFVPRGVVGWYYQQFLKMAYAKYCEAEYYLVWDGDTVPCAPFSMFSPGSDTPYFDTKTEYFKEYFETMGTILPGLHKVIQGSFVSEHMLFRCDIMKQLIADIEANDRIKGNAFYEKIIYAIPKEILCKNSFSEFETYGTYVAMRHTAAYRLRRWHSFRYGGRFLHPETMTDDDYLWFSKDFDAISYEKEQSVRPDHENLFQNKEYQSKLTARTMLEIAQEEFEGGMIEEW